MMSYEFPRLFDQEASHERAERAGKDSIGSPRVFITGASRGIGLACSRMFSQDGWNVIGHYNSTPINGVQCDFSDQRQVSRLLDYLERLGPLDMLINNAGINSPDIQRIFQVNTIVPTLIAQKVFGQMVKGNIVNVSSIAAYYGSPLSSIFYGQSKRALEGCTRTLSRLGAKKNIMVNTVRPGVTNTDFHKGREEFSKRIEKIPIGRMSEPEEIARVIFNLRHNTLITGQTITIAGGE